MLAPRFSGARSNTPPMLLPCSFRAHCVLLPGSFCTPRVLFLRPSSRAPSSPPDPGAFCTADTRKRGSMDSATFGEIMATRQAKWVYLPACFLALLTAVICFAYQRARLNQINEDPVLRGLH